MAVISFQVAMSPGESSAIAASERNMGPPMNWATALVGLSWRVSSWRGVGVVISRCNGPAPDARSKGCGARVRFV